MQDFLDAVIKILTQVHSDAHNHKQELIKNESATRTTLIDPVLRGLGWEIGNPSMVVVESPVKRGVTSLYADYALRANNTVKVVVEAKSLGQELKLHRSQVVDYAFAFKITSIFLTNGVVWEHYTNLNPKLLEPTQVLNIESGDLRDIATYLVQELGRISVNQDEHVLASLYETLNELMMAAENVVDRISVLETEPSTIHPALTSLKKRIANLDATLTTISPTPNLKNSLSMIESDPVASEIRRWMEEEKISFIEDTPTSMLRRLNERAGKDMTFLDFWPKTPASLTKRLNRVSPDLKAIGITVNTTGRNRTGSQRMIKISTKDYGDKFIIE